MNVNKVIITKLNLCLRKTCERKSHDHLGSISADLLCQVWSAGSFPERRVVIEPNDYLDAIVFVKLRYYNVFRAH